MMLSLVIMIEMISLFGNQENKAAARTEEG